MEHQKLDGSLYGFSLFNISQILNREALLLCKGASHLIV